MEIEVCFRFEIKDEYTDEISEIIEDIIVSNRDKIAKQLQMSGLSLKGRGTWIEYDVEEDVWDIAEQYMDE